MVKTIKRGNVKKERKPLQEQKKIKPKTTKKIIILKYHI